MCGRSARTGWARTAKPGPERRGRGSCSTSAFAHCHGSPASGLARSGSIRPASPNGRHCECGPRFRAYSPVSGPTLRPRPNDPRVQAQARCPRPSRRHRGSPGRRACRREP
jgi:hypothetical protein